MTWSFFKALLPTMVAHFAMALVAGGVIWWYLKKLNFTQFKLSGILFLAAGFSFWHSAGIFLEWKQGQHLAQWQQEVQQEQAAAAEAALPGNDPKLELGSEKELQVRQQFLKILEQGIASPQQLNEQARKQIYSSFKGVYGNPKLLQAYKANINNLLLCGKIYITDAMESLNQRKEVRSKDLQTCMGLGGEFYGRKQILDETFVKTYEGIISSGGRAPASKDSGKKLTHEDLKSHLQRQELALQVAAFLFPQ